MFFTRHGSCNRNCLNDVRDEDKIYQRPKVRTNWFSNTQEFHDRWSIFRQSQRFWSEEFWVPSEDQATAVKHRVTLPIGPFDCDSSPQYLPPRMSTVCAEDFGFFDKVHEGIPHTNSLKCSLWFLTCYCYANFAMSSAIKSRSIGMFIKAKVPALPKKGGNKWRGQKFGIYLTFKIGYGGGGGGGFSLSPLFWLHFPPFTFWHIQEQFPSTCRRSVQVVPSTL